MAVLAEQVGLERVQLSGLTLPAVLRLASPMSDEELLEFSALNRDYRIESNADGDLEIMSPLGGRGGKAESFVITHLTLWAELYGGETFSSNTGFRLSPQMVRSPDASWISAERWNGLTAEQQKRFPPLAPDFVVELTSPTHSRRIVEAKMQMWIEAGVRLAWMIDPSAEDVTIYQHGIEPEKLNRPDWVEAATVVPGFRLRTGKIWEMQSF